PGLLPKWLLLVSAIATGNSIQSYLTLAYTRRVYSTSSDPAKPSPLVTSLSSRTFGTWTFLSALIRYYTAYHISDPVLYDLCLWSYIVAFAHFTSEWLIFKSARLNEGLIGPIIVSTLSIAWMVLARAEY
ncbi:hypothetical protein BDZ91DRAFT_643874, partial [Kalaharituber pfeilii]